MPDYAGQQLGNYRLVHRLGRGAFAEVYLGEHLRLNTQAAIKVLHTSLEENDAESFLREARTVAHLKHPHIVRVLDFDVDNHTPFLIMDYLPNGSLRHAYPKGTPLPLAIIVSYVKQAASALQYAHDEKLIHRDIKPENMLLDKDHTIVLSDFGIALMAQSSHYQSTKEVAGTATYMAPEQFRGHPRFASDQYALGIVVYEWLTGDRPFHGTFTEIASQHMFVPPPSLRGKIQEIGLEVEQVVLRALEKDPQRRFRSVQEFATALEQASEMAITQPITQPAKGTPLKQPSSAITATETSSSQLPSPTRPATSSHTTLPVKAPSTARLEGSTPVSGLQKPVKTAMIPESRPHMTMISHRRGLSLSRTTLLIGLAVLALVSSAGFYSIVRVKQVNGGGVHASNPVLAYTTATSSANVDATATAYAIATASVIAQNPDPYPPTNGKLVFYDRLRDTSSSGLWDNNNECGISAQAYHISSSQGLYFQGIHFEPGIFPATLPYETSCPSTVDFSDLNNFTFEVQMKIIKGNCGGIFFRGDGSYGYFFRVCQDGTYRTYGISFGGATVLDGFGTNKFSAAIHTGLIQSNVIAVVTIGTKYKLYINHRQVDSIDDSTDENTSIGLFVLNDNNIPYDAAFNNAKVWKL